MSNALDKTVESKITQVAGVTSNQLRQRLSDSAGVFIASVQQRSLAKAVEQLSPRLVAQEVKRVEQTFPRREFAADGGAAKPAPASDEGVLIEDILVVLNGTAYYTNLLTDGRLDPA